MRKSTVYILIGFASFVAWWTAESAAISIAMLVNHDIAWIMAFWYFSKELKADK